MNEERRTVWHGKRSMLNLPGMHSTGSIVAEIIDTRRSGRTPSSWPEACLQISDCDRSVKISIDVNTPQETENTLHKIDTMISALRALRKGVVTESKRYEATK